MDLNKFSASKFLSKFDVAEQGTTLTIASFGVERMQDRSEKPYINWQEPGYKPLLLNGINRTRLVAICGSSHTEAMVGKRVVVYYDPMVEMQGQVVGGLRIRPVPAPPAPPLGSDVEAALALAKARADAVTQAITGQPLPAQDAPFNDDIPF